MNHQHGTSYGVPPEHLISADVPGGAAKAIEDNQMLWNTGGINIEENLTPDKGGQDEFINDESLCFDLAERQKHQQPVFSEVEVNLEELHREEQERLQRER